VVSTVISIGLLGGGQQAAEYYLRRAAGCELEYYTGRSERAGVWVGPGAAALGLTGELDDDDEEALRALLAGQAPDGRLLVNPVLRADPRGFVPTAPLLNALRARAAERGVGLTALLADRSEVAPVLARLVSAGETTVPVRLAGRLAIAAGLDPTVLYPPSGPAGDYAGALVYADARVDVRRSGLDVTVSAPKSVSVLWGLGNPTVAAQVRAGHQAAVVAALDYLSTEAGQALRGHQGDGVRASRMATDGLVVAAFEHRTSRAGDPQLHTHLVIPNLVRGADGRFSAVDSRAVFAHALTASYTYQAVLRAELTRRLGVGWGPTRRGIAEIEGIPPEVLRAFSRRRVQIEAALAAIGRSDPTAAGHACLATRPAKPVARDLDGPAGLRAGWAGRLAELGRSAEELTHRVLSRARPVRAPTGPEAAAVLLAPTGLTASRSSFDRRRVQQAICQALPSGASVTLAGLRSLTAAVLADPEVIPLVRPAGAEASLGERAYSTVELLATEQNALTLAAARHDAGVAVVDPMLVGAALAADRVPGRRLSVDQIVAVRELTQSGHGVQVLVGAAGSGKTAALAAANRAWCSAGFRVTGAALAASAARTLEQGSDIPATSLARLFGDVEDARRLGLPALAPGSVLVVDEAGIVGMRELARLLEVTSAAKAKLVLIGDPAQLPEIAAGGLFAALAARGPTLELRDNQRQRHDWEREALARLRAGDITAALTEYAAHRRLHVASRAEELRERLVTDYLGRRARVTNPFEVVVVTARRADARAANEAIRAGLRASGQLGPELAVPAGSTSRTSTDNNEQPARSVAVGDLVLVTANDYRRGLRNGTRAVVTGVHPDAGELALRTQDDRDVAVPVGWLAASWLEHGYALTCHKAQGITVEHTLVYGSAALTRQSGYVALSRGRSTNHLYTTLDFGGQNREPGCSLTGSAANGPDDPAVSAALVRALSRDDRQRLASEQEPIVKRLGRPRPVDRDPYRGMPARYWPGRSRVDQGRSR